MLRARHERYFGCAEKSAGFPPAARQRTLRLLHFPPAAPPPETLHEITFDQFTALSKITHYIE